MEHEYETIMASQPVSIKNFFYHDLRGGGGPRTRAPELNFRKACSNAGMFCLCLGSEKKIANVKERERERVLSRNKRPISSDKKEKLTI